MGFEERRREWRGAHDNSMGWDGMMDERYISALSYIVTVTHSAIHSISRCIKMSTPSYSRQSTKKSRIES